MPSSFQKSRFSSEYILNLQTRFLTIDLTIDFVEIFSSFKKILSYNFHMRGAEASKVVFSPDYWRFE